MNTRHENMRFRWRGLLVMAALVAAASLLGWRALELHVLDDGFLVSQGYARHLRTVDVPAHRGTIVDRHGETLAASAPVDSLWAHPGEVLATGRIEELSAALGHEPGGLERMLRARSGREFVYLRRHMNPDDAETVLALGIPGVYVTREYKRYYPSGEVTAHVLGFTDIDDLGQEGVELAFDEWLRGRPGRKQVMRDRMGRVIADVQSIEKPHPGQVIELSIDRRIQYLAYRELKAAVERHDARGGSLVVLDVNTGEILAMVNQPSFNPNNRHELSADRYRNRAATDLLEPGSAFKPFVLAAALRSGRYRPDSLVDTGPGMLQVSGGTVRDPSDLGVIDLVTVLRRSSNVGASKVALTLDPEEIWTLLQRFGFGQRTDSGFPGEQSGQLAHYRQWREIGQATLSFGYGISVTPLQLAQGYAVIAADGVRHPVTLQRSAQESAIRGSQVIEPAVARQLRMMMEQVIGPGGTAAGARVRGYRVAGKTGTTRKLDAGGYTSDRHISLFAGMAPASDPALVAVVVIDEPSRDEYYGGRVAAPVFGNVMAGALRLLDIPPDDIATVQPVRYEPR